MTKNTSGDITVSAMPTMNGPKAATAEGGVLFRDVGANLVYHCVVVGLQRRQLAARFRYLLVLLPPFLKRHRNRKHHAHHVAAAVALAVLEGEIEIRQVSFLRQLEPRTLGRDFCFVRSQFRVVLDRPLLQNLEARKGRV